MNIKSVWARAALLLALAPVFGLAWTEVATNDAAAQSAPMRRGSIGFFTGTVAGYANGRLTVVTDEGYVLRANINPRTKIALLKPADIEDLEEGIYISSASREKDGENIEALEVRIMEARLNGLGEGYRAFHGGLDANQVMTMAKIVGIVPSSSPPTLQIRIRGREKTMVIPDEAPIMFQTAGDATALVEGAPVLLFTVRSRTGKTDVVRVNVGVDGVVPQIF